MLTISNNAPASLTAAGDSTAAHCQTDKVSKGRRQRAREALAKAGIFPPIGTSGPALVDCAEHVRQRGTFGPPAFTGKLTIVMEGHGVLRREPVQLEAEVPFPAMTHETLEAMVIESEPIREMGDFLAARHPEVSVPGNQNEDELPFIKRENRIERPVVSALASVRRQQTALDRLLSVRIAPASGRNRSS